MFFYLLSLASLTINWINSTSFFCCWKVKQYMLFSLSLQSIWYNHVREERPTFSSGFNRGSMFLDPWWRRASWQRKHLEDPIVPSSWQTGSKTKRGRKPRIQIPQGHPLGGQLPPYRTHLLKFAKSPKNISSSWGPCGPFYSNYCSSHIARKPM